MAKLPNGFNGPFKGRLGKAIAYIVNGENRLRSIPERNKEKDRIETEQRKRMELTNTLLAPVKDFIKFGYNYLTTVYPSCNHHNAAVKVLLKLISGTFPELYIDYSKVLFAYGNLPLSENLAVEVVKEGLKFSWDNTTLKKGASKSDHVMVLAFYPELKLADFIRSGAQRAAGSELLQLALCKKNSIVEIYIAFISDDQSRVSNSHYLGQIKWPGYGAAE